MKNKNNFLVALLILPSLAAFGVFMFWPLIETLYLSFFEWNLIKPEKKFVGFQNYIDLFSDPISYKIFTNTALYLVILLVINFVAPYILSFVLSNIIKKRNNFYKSTIFLPSVISLVVSSILYVWILNPISGPAAVIANAFGLEMPIWSKTTGLVVVVLSLITSWKVFGSNFLIILGGVSGVSREMIEAAKLSDIPTWRIFKDIVLPMSSATGIYVFIITIVQGLQYVFTPIKVITQGGPNYASSSVIYNSYHEAFTLCRTGMSSALSVVTFMFFLILLFMEFKFVEKGVYYEN